jgi:hypothetical protein
MACLDAHLYEIKYIRGDQEGLFKLVMLNFIFKWYHWSNFRLLTASHPPRFTLTAASVTSQI